MPSSCATGGLRDVARFGRKTRIGGKQREILWSIFERTRKELAALGRITPADVFARVTEAVRTEVRRPYAFTVVDEAQDLGDRRARSHIGAGGLISSSGTTASVLAPTPTGRASAFAWHSGSLLTYRVSAAG